MKVEQTHYDCCKGWLGGVHAGDCPTNNKERLNELDEILGGHDLLWLRVVVEKFKWWLDPDVIDTFNPVGNCSLCNRPETYVYHVPECLWRKIVPQELWQEIVCAGCFDRLARKPIDEPRAQAEKPKPVYVSPSRPAYVPLSRPFKPPLPKPKDRKR
jgi:hypothetical protein